MMGNIKYGRISVVSSKELKTVCMVRVGGDLILLSFILNQLENNLASSVLRMLHANLDCAATIRQGGTVRSPGQPTGKIDGAAGTRGHGVCAGTRQAAAVIKANNTVAGNDLTETAIHSIADLHEIVVEEDEEFAIQAGRMCVAHELHNYAAGDVAVFINVNGALCVDDEELAVAETEHAQWSELSDALGDAREVGLGFWGLGT